MSRRSNGREDSALPHSFEAEQAVLGGLLLDNPAAWRAVANVVSAEDFYQPEYKLIFAAIGALAGSGKPCGVPAVVTELERESQLTAAGGMVRIGSLARETATASTIQHYAHVVLERSQRRAFIEAAERAAMQARNGHGSSLEELIHTTREELHSIERRGRRESLDWRALELGNPPEREWAIEHWLGMGHVTLLAGGGGTGKTLLAQAMGSCLALRREYLDWMPAERRVLMWATEDDRDELWRRQRPLPAGSGSRCRISRTGWCCTRMTANRWNSPAFSISG
jgi:hypothetical protein